MKTLILLLLLLCGCATAIQSPDGISYYQKIVEDNDVEILRAALKNKSFISKISILDYQYKDYNQYQAYQMLDLALTGMNGNSLTRAKYGTCRTEIVKLLLEANLPPRAIDLTTAAETACPETVTLIVERLSSVDILKGSEDYLKSFKQKIISGHSFYRDINNSQRHLEVLVSLNLKAPTLTGSFMEAEELLSRYVLKPVQESSIATTQIETKYHLTFCLNSNLFAVLSSPFEKVEDKCIYILNNAPLKALQVLDGGILATPVDYNFQSNNFTIFIQTKMSYVTGQFIGKMLLKYDGVMKYKSIMGTDIMVHKFNQLD